MKIVCAASVFMGGEAFRTLGPTEVVADEAISPETVRDADLLLVRTRTRVDRALLEGSRVAFVGTATAGTDHVLAEDLADLDVAWCGAPGCNARSVAEYVVAALLHVATRRSLVLEDMTLGVVGVGHVGRQVVALAEAMGMRVLKNDPPLREATGDKDYLPLDEVLRSSDVVTLHVPLVHERPWPTVKMANHRFFELIKPGALFLNTARGEVVDADALMHALERGAVGAAVLDVWEHEPGYSVELLAKADLGTAHIAGHSLEGKLNGTVTVYREAAHFLEQQATWVPPPLPSGCNPGQVHVDARGRTDEEALALLVRQVYDIAADDEQLRQGSPLDERAGAEHFARLRREYAVRREFAATRVRLLSASPTLERKVAGLGFAQADA